MNETKHFQFKKSNLFSNAIGKKKTNVKAISNFVRLVSRTDIKKYSRRPSSFNYIFAIITNTTIDMSYLCGIII